MVGAPRCEALRVTTGSPPSRRRGREYTRCGPCCPPALASCAWAARPRPDRPTVRQSRRPR
eukprot:5142410-Prymnesium_polylepis.1